MPLLDPDRLFPSDPVQRGIARDLYARVKDAPILSPHGHTDPRWYAENAPFPDPARLFVTPDHYVFRMLYSQGVSLESLGIPAADGRAVETDPRAIWRLFARHYHLLRGTPSRLWIDHALSTVFGIEDRLSDATADAAYDRIADCLSRPDYRPRALFDRFNIEAIATTESPLDDLRWHRMIRDSGWPGRVITAYRPDIVTDPDLPGFHAALDQFADLTGCDTGSFAGYLDAHRIRRAFFRDHGATSTDHGHPSAQTANLSQADAAALYDRVRRNVHTAAEAEAFRGQMLTEMARMSLDDGMVMQLHPGSVRNHSAAIMAGFGRDKGFDIPARTEYVHALRPLLDAVGLDPRLTLILFTLDESSYARELAPLAGAYPCLRLGPPWWFHDSFEGMMRFRQMATETAGFYNTVGFNDDTRAFCSIPARHDVARRVDCAFLAGLVATGRLDRDEAEELAPELAHGLARKAYML